jgi:amino acid transporter
VIAGPQETILSALARRLFDNGVLYYIIQFATLGILTVAANTSFAGFPRLAAILARDGFLPRQFSSPGDRLAFTNGILILGFFTAVLIILFSGDTHALIPLFAIGAFLAFTLSQAGMVVHWWKERGRHWGLKSFINGIGALATLTTLVVVIISKFREGAWITILIILSRGPERTLAEGAAALAETGGADARRYPDFRHPPRDGGGGQFCAFHF